MLLILADELVREALKYNPETQKQKWEQKKPPKNKHPCGLHGVLVSNSKNLSKRERERGLNMDGIYNHGNIVMSLIIQIRKNTIMIIVICKTKKGVKMSCIISK